MGRAMLHLAIVFAEMERDLARERTLAGLERVRATGKHIGRRKGVSRKRAEEIQNMRRARRPLMGPHRHDNRVAFQQRPPDLHLESRRDSALGLRRMITRAIGAWVVYRQTDTCWEFLQGQQLCLFPGAVGDVAERPEADWKPDPSTGSNGCLLSGEPVHGRPRTRSGQAAA